MWVYRKRLREIIQENKKETINTSELSGSTSICSSTVVKDTDRCSFLSRLTFLPTKRQPLSSRHQKASFHASLGVVFSFIFIIIILLYQLIIVLFIEVIHLDLDIVIIISVLSLWKILAPFGHFSRPQVLPLYVQAAHNHQWRSRSFSLMTVICCCSLDRY